MILQVVHEVDERRNLSRIVKTDPEGRVVSETTFEYEGDFSDFVCAPRGVGPEYPPIRCFLY